jgi:glycosyltransferase involved in cell wall biosynthesis
VKLLHTIHSLDPAGGGVMETVRQITEVHGKMGVRSEVVCLDPPEVPYLKGWPIPVHPLATKRTGYGYTNRMVPWLEENLERFDAVIVNGLWQFHGLAVARAARGRKPYFVCPHGMLDPWFKQAYPLKHAKKWLYWPWAEYRVLRDAAGVVFTSHEECRLARESFWLYRAKEAVIPYGITAPPPNYNELDALFLHAHPGLRGKRLILFLSRIHPKKGCDLLLHAFAQVSEQFPDAHLLFAGPDQINWRRDLEVLAQKLGVVPRVHWLGMLHGEMKWGALRAAELFVLPSHQENFGLAVVESLACGTPVLISRKVNIWSEIEKHGGGLFCNPEVNSLREQLALWLQKSPAEREEMRSHAHSCYAWSFKIEQTGELWLKLIRGTQCG